jgi:hypothetical protein
MSDTPSKINLKQTIDNLFQQNPVLGRFIGGTLVGGGAASLVGLLAHLQDEQRKEKLYDSTAFDDQVIYLKKKKHEDDGQTKLATAEKPSIFEDAFTLAAPFAGLYAGYSVIRKLIHERKKQQLQKELDEAQVSYYEHIVDPDPKAKIKRSNDARMTPTQKAMKERGVSFDTSDINLLSVPMAATLLLALATAKATPKVLDKYSPPPKIKRKEIMPKKVLIAPDDEDDELIEKDASDAEVELMLRTISGDKDRFSLSGLDGILGHIGEGKIDELREAIEHGGVDSAFAISKSSSMNDFDSARSCLAFKLAGCDPFISEAIKPIVAAEIYNMSPSLVYATAQLTEDQCDNLTKLAQCAIYALREAELGISGSVENEELSKRASTEVYSANKLNEIVEDLLKI